MNAARPVLPGSLSQSYALLEMIAISGELPTGQIKRLHGGERYKKLLIMELRKNKLISTFHKDKLRGLRLTASAKGLLLADNPERFSFCLKGNAETNRLKGEYKRRLRLHRLSETYVTMRNAGIVIFRDEKPACFTATDNKSTQPPVNPCFYSSREIKEAGDEYIKIRGSRAAGVLLTSTDAFIVYNTGSSLMRWDYNAETRMKTLMQSLLCRNRVRYKQNNIHGLMLGTEMSLAHDILSLTAGANGNYLALGREHTGFHYIPNDNDGETLLRLLCSRDIRSVLESRLSEGLNRREPGLRIENDAIDEDDCPVLFAYDFDMPRIVRFNTALQLYEKSGTLICFDFQADVLRRYCRESISIRVIDTNSFRRRFFP